MVSILLIPANKQINILEAMLGIHCVQSSHNEEKLHVLFGQAIQGGLIHSDCRFEK